MKKIFTSIMLIAGLSVSALSKEMSTGFFLDNYSYAYRFNPAIASETGFVGIAIGNINASAASGVGLGSIIFKNPSGSGLVTGFNKAISTQTFLSGLKDKNNIWEDADYNVFALAFKTQNAFHNIEINVRESVSSSLPKDIFALAKSGAAGTYDISGTKLSAGSFVELAYGQTRRIGDKFTVGARIKFLVGIACADLTLDNSTITMDGSAIKYNVNGNMQIGGTIVGLKTKTSAYNPSKTVYDFNGASMGNVGPGGFGGAVDLGATFKPVDNLTLSLSVLDLGGIAWKYDCVGVSRGSDSFAGVTYKADGTVGSELEDALNRLKTLAEFEKADSKSSFSMLSATINAGVKYSMPFYERLTAVATFSYFANAIVPSAEFRVGASLTPVDWFSLAANYGVNSYNPTFGVAASLDLGKLNLHVGYEGYSGKLGRVGSTLVPVSSCSEVVKAGVTIKFGERTTRFSTRTKGFKNIAIQ